MPRLAATLLAGALLAHAAQAASPSAAPPAADADLRGSARQVGERRARLEAAPWSRPARTAAGGLLLFVSRGMPGAELRAALDEATHDPRLTLVLRGVLPGETLADAAKALARAAAGHRPPAIVIDPPAFGHHGIDAVPTLADPATGEKLVGAISSEALEMARRHAPMAQPEPAGPTWPIAELDLGAVIRTRAAAIDLAGRAQAALQRFWRQVPALVLPPVERSSVRRLRPAALTANDLIDHRGRILLPARARLNPLETLPLTGRLLVVDAQDPREIAWARQQNSRRGAALVLATNPDRRAGWPGWQALQQALAAPVYLLDRHLAQRLAARATPTLIEVQGPELVLTETALIEELAP